LTAQNPLAASVYQTSRVAASNAGCDIAKSAAAELPDARGGETKYATSRGCSGSWMLKIRRPELMNEQAAISGSTSRGIAQ
jgi:hypothetical protein